MSSEILLKTDLPLPLFVRGKVRDTYDLGELLLVVATDRISAFDVVLPCGIPDKGKVLNHLSAFWFKRTTSLIPNHLIEVIDDPRSLDAFVPAKKRFHYPSNLKGRSMVVKKLARINIECVVRGYITGSAWADYQRTGAVCGYTLPRGLIEAQELPEPIFTPTTKAESGHDMPLTIREKVLMEMVRVTKPEGMIIIVDYSLPENRIGRFLVYHFVKIYEKEYYSKFIKSDLEALLGKSGIKIKEKLRVLLGAGRILIGVNLKLAS